ncbi:ABC transporter ATP-binding protein [Cohnella panacarvi]|uniref:ABC transporter ATP-binding protein n=1 Tax=Cohnella panacarvi TaxID=400776 RepID=UPI00047AC7C5|nr:ABC transporter ATP-binding protein [Cohnella panacarvi]
MSLLEVTGLVKKFGVQTAVDGLNFEITPGRCLALLGPNGAGKTTTLRMLSGLLEPTSGTIRFTGGSEKDIRGIIGYLPQYPAFFNWMSGREFLSFAAKLAGLSGKEAAARTEEVLERVGLKESAKRRIGGYSGGMKQRLGLAQAVIHRPKLLILDEPVSALDPQGRREVLELMREMKRETTILFSTHVLHDVEEISEEAIIMDKGRIIVQGDLQKLLYDHEQPLIRVKARNLPIEWVRGLRKEPFVRELNETSDGFTVLVTDVSLARSSLLRSIADLEIEVESFEIGATSLEDLFLRAVSAG